MNSVEMWKVILLLAIVCNYPERVMTVLKVRPRNTTVKVGDNAYLNCSTESNTTNVIWKHGIKSVNSGESINDPYGDRFRIESESDAARNLVIRSVKLSDAGKYICEDDGTNPQPSSAELIVIDKDPICKPNIDPVKVIGPNSCGLEPETVQFACSLSYSGNSPPELTWKRRGENVTITEGVTNTTNATAVTCVLSFKANNLNEDNSSFICETTQAENQQYRCSTPVVKILYVFSNSTIVRKSVDEKIVCLANSSQMCSYNWKWFKDHQEVSVSNNNVLNPDTETGSYRCEAECQIRNESCFVVSMVIEVVVEAYEVEAYSSSSPPWWMILIIIGTVGLIVLLLLIFAMRKRRSLKTRNQQTLSAEREITADSLLLTSNEADIKEVKEKETSNADAIGETSAEPVTWNLSQGGQEVRGLTIGDDRIYVLIYNPIYVEAYDIEGHTVTGSRSLSGIVMFPCDMAYCKHYKRLYIMDGTKEGKTKKIVLLNEFLNLIRSWKSSFDYGNLSVAFDCNVILAAPNAIIEYTPEGKVFRRITVHDTVIPLCVIKIDAYNFLVSRGQRDGDMYEVCLVKTAKNASTEKTCQVEKIEKSFGSKVGPDSERLNNPRSLAVSENKDVFVLDGKNNRVLKLNSDLVFKEEILLSNHRLQSPVKICLNESKGGRLVVAGNSVDVKYSDAGIIGILVLPVSLKNR